MEKGGHVHIIDALNDTEPGVRICAAGALGRIGAQAAEALPHLDALLRDNYPEVRSAAKQARKAIKHAIKKERGA
ncbi:MAG: HEAT repeat domain-containing protein [Proteobacteria bacterium]|nr:HEAT repeat domain-containing protein [Pseudomonadota bacterium]